MRIYLFAAFLILFGCSTNSKIENRSISNIQLSWIDLAQEISQESVDNGYNAGIALGIIDESGKQSIYTYGKMDVANNLSISESTIFEIGSITKVLTAELLAKFVVEKKVSLDDEIKKFIPTLATSDAGKVTLRELSTHTSGLPRLPDNLNPKDPTNPYADYNREQLIIFLQSYKETKAKPYGHKYSNLAVGLLGLILAELDSKSYEETLIQEVLIPLKIPMTITLSKDQKKLFATPYSSTSAKTSHWDFGILIGAGGVRATIQDLLNFARAHLKPESTPLKETSLLMQEIHNKTDNTQMGLGWIIGHHPDGLIYLHDGGTGGFGSLIMIQPSTGRALTMLSNSANIVPCLVRYFKKEDCKVKKVHSMPLEKMQRFLGNYESDKKEKMSIVLSENKKFLISIIPSQQPWVLKAASETFFNLIAIDASLVFPEGEGPIKSFVLKQGGKDFIYTKVETGSN